MVFVVLACLCDMMHLLFIAFTIMLIVYCYTTHMFSLVDAFM